MLQAPSLHAQAAADVFSCNTSLVTCRCAGVEPRTIRAFLSLPRTTKHRTEGYRFRLSCLSKVLACVAPALATCPQQGIEAGREGCCSPGTSSPCLASLTSSPSTSAGPLCSLSASPEPVVKLSQSQHDTPAAEGTLCPCMCTFSLSRGHRGSEEQRRAGQMR
ncbi:hypothetical protein E2C01_027932 [Portunus trituberculatus]|uniref:Uncharacterized protein n=1 Tax=Portunus trituberculatus TaxID=210409 RepID=A0A5B7EJ74_PORTR|nr:hypothetical protein [Portunus trituberculatus]